MKILILGGGGMLGHQLWRHLRATHDVWVTLRRPVASYAAHNLFDPNRAISGVDVASLDTVREAFGKVKPDVLINCVGIIKQVKEANNPLISLAINSMLPHQLSGLCAEHLARLVHFSTDCVFSGRKGQYVETDVSDAEDLYGRTKFLGEVHEPHCLTLRTSIIGRELGSTLGLLEWFLSQEGRTIKGFRRAIYTGFTTQALARLIDDLLTRYHDMSGVWHVASDPIDKYDLLCLAKQAFGWQGTIEPDDTFVCDRSLDSTRFRQYAGFTPPTWETMMAELAASPR